MPMLPAGLYGRGGPDGFAPDGKMLRAYNSKIFETLWGPVYDAPILYLYDKENKILATYNVFELIFKNNGGGEIQIAYNEERNSFDMIFSLDAHGNYGTAYIDLNTNEFIRELLTIPEDEQREREREQQGIIDGYIEGSNLRRRESD